jgi:hypothetical protein
MRGISLPNTPRSKCATYFFSGAGAGAGAGFASPGFSGAGAALSGAGGGAGAGFASSLAGAGFCSLGPQPTNVKLVKKARAKNRTKNFFIIFTSFLSVMLFSLYGYYNTCVNTSKLLIIFKATIKKIKYFL